MSLVTHLIRADVRRFTTALAVWCAIVAAAVVLHGVQPAFEDSWRTANLMNLLTAVIWIGGLIVMLGLTAQVVQADPLVGTNAFWMTRPIPPLSLLAAKAVFVGVAIVLVPVAGEVVLMRAHDVTLSTIGTVALQAVVVQLFWVSIAMCYATVTSGLAQFFLLCGATPLALVLLMLLFEFAERSEIVEAWVPSVFEHHRAGAAFVVLVIGAAAALLLMLYRTRSRLHGAVLGLSLTLIAFVLPEFVPPSTAQSHALPEWSTQLAPLTADAVSFRLERSPANTAVLQGRVLTGDFPQNWSATVAVRDSVLSLDGTSTPSLMRIGSHSSVYVRSMYSQAVWEPESSESTTAAALKSVLGVDVIGGLPSADSEAATLFESSGLAALAGKTPRYRASLTLSFVERVISAVLPLEPGASFNQGPRLMSIVAVRATEGSDFRARLTVRESIAKTVLEPDSSPVFEIYLRNTQRNEAVYGSEAWAYRSNDFSPSMLMPVPIVTEGRPFGFRIEPIEHQFPPYTSNDRSIRVDESWLAGAELVIVSVRNAGSIDRVLDIPSVSVPVRDEKP